MLGDRVWKMVVDAFQQEIFEDSLAKTLSVLISKEVINLSSVSQFYLISLYNISYRLITKILINRLRPYLDDIIRPFQASFILQRSTFDNVIIAQEVYHSIKCTQSTRGWMALKIDLAKVYERVTQRFDCYFLNIYNFPERCIKLIMNYVSKATFFIQLKG